MTPIIYKQMKRHEALQPLSREHHQGLLLCWKIRTGLSNNVSPERIKKYVEWFYKAHIEPHFEAEENHIFPLLGTKHEMVKKALADHRRLKRLFTDTEEVEKSLSRIEDELERHIRYEERELFPKIQETATEEQLKLVNTVHQESPFEENTEDEFWK